MAVRSISYHTSASSHFSVAAPPDVVPGDRLICAIFTDSEGEPGAPSGGWSPLTSLDSSEPESEFSGPYQLRTRIWHRSATADDPPSYSFTQSSGADGVVIIAAVSDASSATPRFKTATDGPGAEQITTPGVTLPSGQATELRFAAGTGVDGVDPSWVVATGFTRWTPGDLSSRQFTNAVLGVRAITSPGATGTAVFDSHWPQDFLHAVTIVVPAASSGGGTSPTVPPPTIPALPSSEQVVHYTYAFVDLLTDHEIAKDLDLHDVTYTRKINEGGSFSATVDITDAVTAGKVARIVPRHYSDLSTGPGRTMVHVYRNGVIWGSYIMWSAEVSRGGRDQNIQVKLDGTSLESYLAQVKIRDDLGPYEGQDQIDLARTLLDAMQGTARYNIGLQLQTGISGVTRNLTVAAADSTTYGEQLQQLAESENGFEYAIHVVDNGDGTRSRVWTWGYPVLGTTSSHVFTEPGNVLSWSERIDALRGGIAFQTRGDSIQDDASETSAPLTSSVTLADDWIAAGWPGIDKTVDYSGVQDVTILNNQAVWLATTIPGAVRIHQATVRLPANTSFGPGNLGDRVTLMLTNPWWPIEDGVATFAKSWRVVGMAFTPPAKGSGIETCVLTFEEAGNDSGGG
ncbi:MAG TPA: hypothetical protein VIS06_02340 [Mycobacteriales bacterium]|jgi:hypothetical protein